MKVAAALLTRTSSGASRQIASIIASTAAPSRMSHLTAATESTAHLGCRRLQQFEPAAADNQLGAKRDEAASHRRAEPGASAGDQYPLSRQEAFFKHCFIPCFSALIARSAATKQSIPQFAALWVASLRLQ